jgi:selenocysteine-specific elongation factor
MSAPGPLTLGTAGHIDHGKTALVKALTGTDTDRLAQEHERGISIELGFAQLALPSGRRLSVVDVPGHERFVRTMVAGASGIDLYVMVVAADDGVMPQTREHAAVLRALGIETGVIAVTKSDLADPARALAETRELLPDTDAVTTSVRTGDGLPELVAALERAAVGVPSRADAARPPRLHVDRVFTIKGAGTVVTGTLWSGAIARGDALTILPAGTPARVRGVQVHDQPVDAARAGQRVAVNLAIGRDEVARGVLLAGGDVNPTRTLDAALELDGDVEHGARVQVHHGTRETPGRLAALGGRFWQVRLERPLMAVDGDRLVIRRISPPGTLGGGTVLDANARRHGATRDTLARLTRIARDETPGVWSTNAPHSEANVDQPVDQPAAAASCTPARPAPPAPPAALTDQSINAEERLREAWFEPPPDSEFDPADLAALRAHGRAIRVSKTLHFHPDAIEEARTRAVQLARRNRGTITLAELRDELGTSRRYAEALLSHLDATRVTIRRGDRHALRGAGPARSAR